ncbi:MAG: hypothetical protein EBR68_06340, partial [Synechococcaceae bacterium WB4_2_0811]|nr:hypothetical protein [Synechococcaceae bacterium WB4_2_0811]
DYLTLQENFGQLKGLTLAYVGDGNNVAHSLLLSGALLGVNVRIGCPEGFEPAAAVLAQARALAGGRCCLEVVADPMAAVTGAQAIYTDVWASMGQEQEQQDREKAFKGFCLNQELLNAAGTIDRLTADIIRDSKAMSTRFEAYAIDLELRGEGWSPMSYSTLRDIDLNTAQLAVHRSTLHTMLRMIDAHKAFAATLAA